MYVMWFAAFWHFLCHYHLCTKLPPRINETGIGFNTAVLSWPTLRNWAQQAGVPTWPFNPSSRFSATLFAEVTPAPFMRISSLCLLIAHQYGISVLSIALCPHYHCQWTATNLLSISPHRFWGVIEPEVQLELVGENPPTFCQSRCYRDIWTAKVPTWLTKQLSSNPSMQSSGPLHLF